jgi:hypothetical protein
VQPDSPVFLRDAQTARKLAEHEHADSGAPQAVFVRPRRPVTDGLEYFVAPVDSLETLAQFGWKVDTVVGEDYVPLELREPHIGLSSEEAGATAAVLAEYWGTPFLVVERETAFAAIALVAWPAHRIQGWRLVPGSRVPPSPEGDLAP